MGAGRPDGEAYAPSAAAVSPRTRSAAAPNADPRAHCAATRVEPAPAGGYLARVTPAVANPARRYWAEARAPRYSVTFAVPLFVLYEVLAAVLHTGTGGLRNGADVMLKSPFVAVLGDRGPLVFAGLLAAVSAWLVGRDIRAHGRPRLSMFWLMLLESAALAAAFGVVIGTITTHLLGPLSRLAIQSAPAGQGGGLGGLGPGGGVMVSLGAGLYEELLFRVVLVGALLWGGRKLLGWGRVASGTMAVVGGALVFSAFHYIGPYGDPLQVGSFTFRAVAGLAFSGLYVTRGFGITAWTHALYDLLLVLLGVG